jgi:hypothetical protein
MYTSKYFSLKELLPQELHSLPENIGWLLMDDRVLIAGDKVRELYGECIINGNGLNDCGLRLQAVGKATYSQHLYGRAIDIHILGIEKQNLEKELKIKEYNKVRDKLSKLKEFKNIRFEDNISWLHIDCGNSNIKRFNP